MPNIPTRQNNPGDLKVRGQIATFGSPLEGKAALYNDLTAKMTGTSTTGIGPSSSLVDFAKVYAPASDNNNPLQYAANLANHLGISPDTQIGSLKNRIDDFANAVSKNEGYQSPTTFNPKPYSQPSPGAIDYSGSSDTSTPTVNSISDPSFGGIISKSLGGAGEALTQASSGKINPISGVIQAGGALAGGFSGLVNKTLEYIPGVKRIEQLMGKGVGALAQTDAGKSVIKASQDFSKAHPELANDIGAGFNIATAIPIFKGLGVLKNVAGDTLSSALQDVAEKSATNGLTEVMGAGKTLSKNFAKNGGSDTISNAIKTLGKDALPEIEGGKFATENTFNTVGEAISNIDEKELQPILDEVSKKQSFGQSLSTLEKMAIKEAENDSALQEAGAVPQAIAQIQKRFAGWKYSYGDTVNLGQENRLKIGAGKYVNWNTPEGDADAVLRRTLQKDIENVATQNNMPDVNAINKKMGSLIKYQNMLKALDKGTVKVGKVRRFLQHAVGTGVGGFVGSRVGGTPGELIGGYVGNQASNLFTKKTIGGLTTKLLRQK